MRRIIPGVLFFAFIIWIIVEADRGANNIFFDIVRMVPYGDKIGHALVFGLLTFLAIIAFNNKRIKVFKCRVQLGALLVFGFALLEELTQIFLPNRTFDLVDICFDIVGISIFCYTNVWYTKLCLLHVSKVKT